MVCRGNSKHNVSQKVDKAGFCPFEKTDKSGDPIHRLLNVLKTAGRVSRGDLLESDLSILNDEETAMIVICSTFLLMNDEYVRKENLEGIIHADKVKQNILRSRSMIWTGR